MLVALTSGTGLLGPHLIAALRRRGHTVRVLVRPRPDRECVDGGGVTWLAGGLEDGASLDALTDGCDVILHTAFSRLEEPPPAGSTAFAHYGQTNFQGTMRLLERTAKVGGHQLIYVSSLAVYGSDPSLDPRATRFPRDEDYPVWPRELYGALRTAVEKMVIATAHGYGLNTSVFRLGHVLGMREDRARTSLSRTVDEALAHGELRTCAGSYVIAVEDCAEILAAAVGDDGVRGELYNVFDRWLDHTSVAPLLAELCGRAIGVACDPAPEPDTPIHGARLHARYDHFRTDEALRTLLARLVADRAP